MSTPTYFVGSDDQSKALAPDWLQDFRGGDKSVHSRRPTVGLRDRFLLPDALQPLAATPPRAEVPVEAKLRAGLNSSRPGGLSGSTCDFGAAQVVQDSIVAEGSRLHQEGVDQLAGAAETLIGDLSKLTEGDKTTLTELRERHADATAPISDSYATFEVVDGPGRTSQRQTASIGELASNTARKLEELENELDQVWAEFEQAQKDVQYAYEALIAQAAQSSPGHEPIAGTDAARPADAVETLRAAAALPIKEFEVMVRRLVEDAKKDEHEFGESMKTEMAELAQIMVTDD